MALNLTAILGTIQDFTGDYDSTSETLFTRFINMAYRDVWSAHEWEERKASAWVVTAAPYTTGTVSLTQGADAVTGVGTVFPSTADTTPWRFGASYSTPWYVVSARGGDTALTLAEDFTETTLAASNYVLYANTFSMPAAAEKVRYVLVMQPGYTNPDPITKRTMDEMATMPVELGIPSSWCVGGNDSNGYLTVQVAPIPDGIYRMHVHYLKKITELSTGTDEPFLEERRRDLIIERALWHAYRFKGDNRAADQLVIYQRRLAEAISNETQSDSSPQFKRFDSGGGDVLITYAFPAEEGS